MKIKCIAITVKNARCSWPHAKDSKFCNYHINYPPVATVEDIKAMANGATPEPEQDTVQADPSVLIPVNYYVNAIKCPNCNHLWEA